MSIFYKRSPQKAMYFIPIIHYKGISTSQTRIIVNIYIDYVVVRNSETYYFKREMFSLFEISYKIL